MCDLPAAAMHARGGEANAPVSPHAGRAGEGGSAFNVPGQFAQVTETRPDHRSLGDEGGPSVMKAMIRSAPKRWMKTTAPRRDAALAPGMCCRSTRAMAVRKIYRPDLQRRHRPKGAISCIGNCGALR